MGDEALGIVSPVIYSAEADTPANRRFVAEYRKRFGKIPSYFSETWPLPTRDGRASLKETDMTKHRTLLNVRIVVALGATGCAVLTDDHAFRRWEGSLPGGVQLQSAVGVRERHDALR